jgi:cholera toxin transcriptional activator
MPTTIEPRVYRFGLYEADMRSGELRKNGLKLRLQGQPFEVLGALLERPGEVVTREELRQRLWPADTFVDFDHSLNTAINKVREVLGDSATNPRFVETLARRGYRFIAPVQVVEQPPIASGQVSVEQSPVASRQSPVEAAGQQANSAADIGPAASDQPPATELRPRTSDQQPAPSFSELPRIPRGLGRGLLAAIQVMYLCFYLASMWKLREVDTVVAGITPAWETILVVAVIVGAVLGIPTRLYLLTAVLFDFRRIGVNFERIFPFVLALDELWALSPFLLQEHIGFGLAFAATATLVYVPFSQRTLMRMTYPETGSAIGS